MGFIDTLAKFYFKYRIRQLRKQGLIIPEDCRLASMPDFGSEPYLITIGKRVAIAEDVSFITHDGGTHVFRHLEKYKRVIKYGRIAILDNSIIGKRAIILPGVTIGPDSVVAAGAVVTRTVPPGMMVIGNPAKPVMTTHQYAEWALAATPDYDEAEYLRDKKTFLLKWTARGSGARATKAPNPDGQPDQPMPAGPETSSGEDPET